MSISQLIDGFHNLVAEGRFQCLQHRLAVVTKIPMGSDNPLSQCCTQAFPTQSDGLHGAQDANPSDPNV